MSTQDIKHTPEPWFLKEIEFGNKAIFHNEYAIPKTEDNYNRIVECVNALSGIENPSEYIEGLKAEIERLKAMLIKLRTTYITDLNPNGEPKPSILELITIWDEVNNLINP